MDRSNGRGIWLDNERETPEVISRITDLALHGRRSDAWVFTEAKFPLDIRVLQYMCVCTKCLRGTSNGSLIGYLLPIMAKRMNGLLHLGRCRAYRRRSGSLYI